MEWSTFGDGRLGGSLQINASAARAIIAAIDGDALASLAIETRRYLPVVLAEIETLRSAINDDPRFVTRRAAVFGASTPNRPVVVSVAMSRYFADRIDWAGAHPGRIAETVYAGHPGANGWNKTQLPGSLERGYIRTLVELKPHLAAGALPIRDDCARMHGIRHKVASMMHAVNDPDWMGWTIDRHHVRQMLFMAGMPHRIEKVGLSDAASAAAYHLLEGFWLSYAAQHFHDIPTWAVQWATWNVAFGAHQSHAAIWAA